MAVQFGAHVSVGTGTAQQKVLAFEAAIGHKLDIDHTFIPQTQTSIGTQPSWDVSTGRTPLLTFGTGIPTTAIVAGQYDSYFAGLATQIAALNATTLLRYAHEMDGKANASWVGTPAQFIAAWQYVWNLFKTNGVTGTWVWEPNAFAFPTKAATYYPGATYVDWIAADGYDWGPCRGGTATYSTFTNIFQAFYTWGVAQNKPLAITEFGAVNNPTDATYRQLWFENVASVLVNQMPAITAVVYFDAFDQTNGRSCDWDPTTDAPSLQGFQSMVATITGPPTPPPAPPPHPPPPPTPEPIQYRPILPPKLELISTAPPSSLTTASTS